MRYLLVMIINGLLFSTSGLFASEKTPLIQENSVNSENIAVQFTDLEKNWIAKNRAVTVIGDTAWFPFEGFNEDGKYIGITADILDLISTKSGLIFNVSETSSWQHTIQFSGDQQVDIISASASNPVLEKNYRATHSTIKNPLVMVGNNTMHYIPDLNARNDLRIALVGNTGFSQRVIDTYPEITFISVDHITDGLIGVADEQFDIALMSMSVASYQMAELGLYEFRIVGVTDLDMELTLYVNRNKPILWSIINKTKLNETKQEQNDILAKWIKQRYIDRYSPEKIRALWLIIAILIIFVVYRHRLLKKQAKVLTELSQTDKLTNIHNRLHLDKVLLHGRELSNRYHNTFSIILIDIDFFKQVNDKNGHIVGDKFLQQLALLFSDSIRKSDILGRWGGEEFLIICPETSLPEAIVLAEKLRLEVAQTIFLNVGKKTASFGVAEYQSEESIDSFLGRADRSLYSAKSEGRNQVKTDG